MKYITTILITLFVFCNLNAQNKDIGALKIKDGFLLYNNIKNPYTISFRGDVNFSNYPFVGINGNIFQFNYNESSKFGTTEKEILVNFMNWELEYLKSSKLKIDGVEASFIKSNNGQLIHFWSYTNPVLTNDNKYDDKVYFASFVKNGNVYALCYIAFEGNKDQAQQSLTNIFKGIKFYDQKIDILKLQEAIRNGMSFHK